MRASKTPPPPPGEGPGEREGLRLEGKVVAIHGRHFLVADDNAVVECVTRGKKGGVACGDRVVFALTSAGHGVIESIEPRRNLLYRSDEFRTKLLAANLDLAAIVVAAVPTFREELLIRCLVACEVADIPALIVVNKADLIDTAELVERLTPYGELGYPLLQVSALGEIGELQQRLSGRTTIFVGASGVGKSTLLNRLVPDAQAVTGEISVALDAGKHTTTHARMYKLPSPTGGGAGGAGNHAGHLIDSPGMQEFGLSHLDLDSLMAAFPEIRSRKGACRFHNCRHLKEPGCAILAAAAEGAFQKNRLRVYHALLASLDSRR